MPPETLDPRRHAFRTDLADERLRGRVLAARFVAGEVRQVVHSTTPMRARPDGAASWSSELQFGEVVTCFEEREGWAWVQLISDGYVGYVRAAALSANVRTSTHRVRALGTFLYPEPNMKSPPWLHVGLNAELSVIEVGQSFARLADGGFVPSRHIVPLAQPAADFVLVAERFVGAPYLWGGRTRLGVDCSGLVQASLQACGIRAPRDSDMQEQDLGTPVPANVDFEGVQRGDLVFWQGHVGILVDAFTLLHANAFHMSVVLEPLQTAVDRIARTGSPVTSIKRMREGIKA